MRVLLVTQNDKLDELVGGLDPADITVQKAATQEHALAQLSRGLADAVMIDIELRGLAAVELLGAIKTRHPGVPVVTFAACAGYEEDTAEALSDLGSAAHLAPPFDTDILLRVIGSTDTPTSDKSRGGVHPPPPA